MTALTVLGVIGSAPKRDSSMAKPPGRMQLLISMLGFAVLV